MSAMLPSRLLWAQGPHTVAIGGVTGRSTMLRGLKKYTINLTAIVTVADDGGGSGMLRRDIGMLPPGDIRHCMESLANTEPVMQQLLTYRFESGTLRGQCFGNLLLAALNGVTGSFDEAVRSMGQVLAISGTVIPVTTTDVRLTATFENGAYVVGESNIFGFKKQQDCRIDHVELLPAHPKALPDALDAIAAADLILLGPGSLYTSIIPNLLVDGVAEAIAASDAQKIYVCNIMTQDGETEGYTAADHLEALQRHGREGTLDLCLANYAPIPRGLAARYCEEDAELQRVKDSYPVVWKNRDAKPKLCFMGCPHMSLEQLKTWTDRVEQALAEAGRSQVCIPTVFTAAPAVLKEFEKTPYAARLKKTGVITSYICPLMYMNNPLCGKMPVITSSNKLRTYTTARYYTDDEILGQITKGGAHA